MMFDHPYARQIMGRGLGQGPPLNIPPMPLAPGELPDYRSDDGAAAHALVDSMLGGPQSVTIEDAFAEISSRLSANPANADLAGELESLRGRVVGHLTEQRRVRMTDLERRHDETYEKCRAALDRKSALINRAGEIDSWLHAAQEELGRHKAAAMSAQARRPPNETFPTRGEIASWQTEVAEARQRLDTVQGRFDELTVLAGTVERDFRAANQELDRLMALESRLQAQLDGRPWRNEVVLEIPAAE
jgi:chromosome segregation ATPase